MTVGELVVKIKADIGDLEAKLGEADASMKAFAASTDESGAKTDNLARSLDTTTRDAGLFERAMGGVTGVLDTAVPVFGDVGGLIGGLPIVFGLLAAAAIVLADAFGALVAIVADFFAPLTLVTGLLGGLAVAFGLSFMAASNATTGWGKLQTAMAAIKSEFTQTEHLLAHAFMPIFLQLTGAMSTFLSYVDELAKMHSLSDVFHSLSTQGVQMLGKFVNAVAAVVAHPIRLAFKIAFGAGPGGNEFSSLVSSWWTRFSHFLFGYTQTHQIHIGRFLGPMTKTQVDGVFQPLIAWFDRHDFTKQGRQIGHSILDGFTGSGVSRRIGQTLVAALGDAFKTVGVDFYGLLQRLSAWFVDATNRWHDDVNQFGWNAVHAIEAKLGAAWDWVSAKAHSIWSAIVQWVESAISIHIIWPSPPGWLDTLIGINSGSGSKAPPGYQPGAPRGGHAGNIVAAGGNVIHVHLHGGISDRATARRLARELAPHLNAIASVRG